MGAERGRLEEAGTQGVPWKKWGPYLSERQWGTVRQGRRRGERILHIVILHK